MIESRASVEKRTIRALVLGFLLLSIAPLQNGSAIAANDILADVDGRVITREDVEKSLAGQLSKLEERIYELKRNRLDALIDSELLRKEADERKIAVAELLEAEVVAKAGLVTESEVERYYQNKKAKFPGDESHARTRVRGYLENQKLTQRRREFLASLRSRAKVTMYLKTPPISRVTVSIDGAPFKGAENAPITIAEFTDFQCPFCKKAGPTLDQLMRRYGSKIKLVFKDFPIDRLHPKARKGHEAARCAHEQGKFWPYHDKLFATAPKAAPDDLRAYAKEIALDMPTFDSCFRQGKYQMTVDIDIDEGQRAGVTGTPTFFINGRLIVGAKPLDSFTQVIDEELARVQNK